MKKFVFIILAISCIFALTGCIDEAAELVADFIGADDMVAYKPVIYIYPEEETQVSVKLDYSGTLTHTYPAYNGGWTINASPEGTLTLPGSEREYYCLFWEGVSDTEYDFSEGFVVKGEKTAEFLEASLSKLGLNDKEANEFIIFWLPKLEVNEYNLISFQGKSYTDSAVLDITPAPDSILRVFMAYKPLTEEIEITPQELEPFERNGFTVVEWGGTMVR